LLPGRAFDAAVCRDRTWAYVRDWTALAAERRTAADWILDLPGLPPVVGRLDPAATRAMRQLSLTIHDESDRVPRAAAVALRRQQLEGMS
jgi:hypothetical protein